LAGSCAAPTSTTTTISPNLYHQLQPLPPAAWPWPCCGRCSAVYCAESLKCSLLCRISEQMVCDRRLNRTGRSHPVKVVLAVSFVTESTWEHGVYHTASTTRGVDHTASTTRRRSHGVDHTASCQKESSAIDVQLQIAGVRLPSSFNLQSAEREHARF
jgi:hypothetical protein